MSFLVTVVVNALAIWVATWIVPGVSVTGDDGVDTMLTYAVVGAIFGLVNAFIKPILQFFTGCLYLITFGLFAFVVNALMLELTEWISDQFGLGFEIDDFFWSAIGAALVVTIVSLILNAILDRD